MKKIVSIKKLKFIKVGQRDTCNFCKKLGTIYCGNDTKFFSCFE